jgi:hypothetical protein
MLDFTHVHVQVHKNGSKKKNNTQKVIFDVYFDHLAAIDSEEA